MIDYIPLEQNIIISRIEDISIQYPGVLHQSFGTLSHLHTFIQQAHQSNIAVLIEVNWALFDIESLVYDIDCSTSEGSFLHSSAASTIGDRSRFDFNPLKKGPEYITMIVERWKNDVGVDGLVWRESGCIVYDGQECRRGIGAMDLDGVRFLQNIVNSTQLIHVIFLNKNYLMMIIMIRLRIFLFHQHLFPSKQFMIMICRELFILVILIIIHPFSLTIIID